MSELLLHVAAQGDVLRLTGAGHWVSRNAHALEAAVEAAAQRYAAAREVDIDMTAVERLDTFGGWLLERLARSFSAQGAATRVSGLREDYRALIEEMHAVDTRLPPPARGAAIRNMLDAIGREIVSLGGYFGNFVTMLGALIVAFARLAAHPRRFR